MDLLLETHALLWYYSDDPKLSATARSLISDPSNRKFVSPASHWEIAIKLGQGKYRLSAPFAVFIREAITDNGFTILPVEPRHTELLIGLPLHHKDPFDRLLIAQALADNLAVVGCDTAFDAYPIRRLW